ncbi:MAG: hypothetical protein M3540_05170 [Actinomycetota bacterium]|nr:hypothetical protein [Actinomycetota bacterium]
MSSARKLRRRRADIDSFAAALRELLGLFEADEWSAGGYPSWKPRADAAPAELARLAAKVDLLAGPAALAFQDSGVFVDWKPRGTMQTQRVNPAPAWRTIFDRDPMFGPDLILQLCAQASGLLETRALDAEEDEAANRADVSDGPGAALATTTE